MKPEEAIKRIENLIKSREDPRGKTELDFALDMAIEALKDQKPHGKWSGEPERRKMVTQVCTACGERSVVGYFCMWCGADMGYSPRRDEKYDPDVIKGKDEKGYFIMVRECIHTDGTPDEWVTTYYKPLPKEGDKE